MKRYILELYGSQQKCADALGVDRKTVYRWINENPWPMVRHAKKILETSNTTKEELMIEILLNEDDKHLARYV